MLNPDELEDQGGPVEPTPTSPDILPGLGASKPALVPTVDASGLPPVEAKEPVIDTSIFGPVEPVEEPDPEIQALSEKLNPRQLAFVEYYLQSLNGTDAARKSGYAFPSVESHRLLRDPKIAPFIKARMQRLIMSTEEILNRLAKFANKAEHDRDSLKALELLGKYRALFIDRVQTEQIVGLDLVDEEAKDEVA